MSLYVPHARISWNPSVGQNSTESAGKPVSSFIGMVSKVGGWSASSDPASCRFRQIAQRFIKLTIALRARPSVLLRDCDSQAQASKPFTHEQGEKETPSWQTTSKAWTLAVYLSSKPLFPLSSVPSLLPPTTSRFSSSACMLRTVRSQTRT